MSDFACRTEPGEGFAHLDDGLLLEGAGHGREGSDAPARLRYVRRFGRAVSG